MPTVLLHQLTYTWHAKACTISWHTWTEPNSCSSCVHSHHLSVELASNTMSASKSVFMKVPQTHTHTVLAHVAHTLVHVGGLQTHCPINLFLNCYPSHIPPHYQTHPSHSLDFRVRPCMQKSRAFNPLLSSHIALSNQPADQILQERRLFWPQGQAKKKQSGAGNLLSSTHDQHYPSLACTARSITITFIEIAMKPNNTVPHVYSVHI